MEEWAVELIALGGLIVLIFANMPVCLALGFTTLVLVLLVWPEGLYSILAIAIAQSSNFLLSAVPLFILMAEFILLSGVSEGLYRMAYRWVGRLPGGLGIASTITCGIMASCTGSSPACEAMVGLIAVPEMRKYNYSNSLSAGTICAAGTLGILIPPSIPFVLYGYLNEVSVGKLFIAGVLPGILMVSLFSLYIVISSTLRPETAPRGLHFSWKEKLTSLYGILPILVLIFLVLASIYLGWATPTEAAGLGCLGSLVIALAFRKLTLSKLKNALLGTVRTTAMIFWIILTGVALGTVLNYAGVYEHLTGILITWASPWVVLSAILLFLLVVGCFLETATLIVVVSPLVAPIAAGVGFDPIWFAVVFVIMIEVALITPPVGFNLFVMKGIAPDISMGEIYRGSIPFAGVAMLEIALITIFPQIVLFLVQAMF